MRAVRRTTTQPYCTCVTKDRSEGWSLDPQTGTWVHPVCGKVSASVWKAHGGFPVSLFP